MDGSGIQSIYPLQPLASSMPFFKLTDNRG
jgi:hypothetical protein